MLAHNHIIRFCDYYTERSLSEQVREMILQIGTAGLPKLDELTELGCRGNFLAQRNACLYRMCGIDLDVEESNQVAWLRNCFSSDIVELHDRIASLHNLAMLGCGDAELQIALRFLDGEFCFLQMNPANAKRCFHWMLNAIAVSADELWAQTELICLFRRLFVDENEFVERCSFDEIAQALRGLASCDGNVLFQRLVCAIQHDANAN